MRVPYVTADGAYALMSVALERFLALVETLGPDDSGVAGGVWKVGQGESAATIQQRRADFHIRQRAVSMETRPTA